MKRDPNKRERERKRKGKEREERNGEKILICLL